MKNVIEYVNRRLPKRKSGGWLDISIEDMIPPEFMNELNMFEVKLTPPKDLVNAVNQFYDERIQMRAFQVYNHINSLISGNFDTIVEGYEQWANNIRSTFNFDRIEFFEDYDPPKYTGTITNISSIDDERQHFIEKSKVRKQFKISNHLDIAYAGTNY